MAKKNKSEPKVYRSPEEIAPAYLQAYIDVVIAKQSADAGYDALESAAGVLRSIENEIKEALESAQQEVK
jgi:hypothetical protein